MHVCNPDWKTIAIVSNKDWMKDTCITVYKGGPGRFLCPESIGRFFFYLEKEVICLNVLLNVHYTISVSVYSL